MKKFITQMTLKVKIVSKNIFFYYSKSRIRSRPLSSAPANYAQLRAVPTPQHW